MNALDIVVERFHAANSAADDDDGTAAVSTGDGGALSPLLRDKIVIMLLQRGTAVRNSTMDKISATVLLAHLQQWDLGTNLHRGNIDRAVNLIENGADVNVSRFDKDKRAPLLIAVDMGNQELVKLLVAHGADQSITDGDENTPLHLAAKRGNVKICKYLLVDKKKAIESGIVHNQNKLKRTPLQEALVARPENLNELVKLLMKCGASMSSRDIELRNALHLFCLDNGLTDTSLAELIIEKDSQSLSQCDKYGMTPFHLAAQSDNPYLIKTILKYRDMFDLYLRDRNDKCAIDYIVSSEVRNIVKAHYIKGWLAKKGEKGLVKLFRKRWFVMNEESIKYYKSQDETDEAGYITVDNIKNVKRQTSDSLKFEVHMKASSGGRVYELMADSQQEFDRWYMSLVRRVKQK